MQMGSSATNAMTVVKLASAETVASSRPSSRRGVEGLASLDVVDVLSNTLLGFRWTI